VEPARFRFEVGGREVEPSELSVRAKAREVAGASLTHGDAVEPNFAPEHDVLGAIEPDEIDLAVRRPLHGIDELRLVLEREGARRKDREIEIARLPRGALRERAEHHGERHVLARPAPAQRDAAMARRLLHVRAEADGPSTVGVVPFSVTLAKENPPCCTQAQARCPNFPAPRFAKR